MHGISFGECMGTLVLLLFRDGAVADALLGKTKGFLIRRNRELRLSGA